MDNLPSTWFLPIHMFDVKDYRAFLARWRNHAQHFSAEELLAELWAAMMDANPTIVATDYSVGHGWRIDIAHGTATALIKPHMWLQGGKKFWDPTIDLMSEFERATFSSRRVRSFDNALTLCQSAGRRIYVLDDNERVMEWDASGKEHTTA